MLELDHVFCCVPPEDDWADRLTTAGWVLDAGSAHHGQGSRNRRLIFRQHYLELVWLEDPAEARVNPLRLDRRAAWTATGASPFGFGLRGVMTEQERRDFWPYDLLGLRIWVHRDNERAPERPMVFVLEIDPATPRRPAEVAANDAQLVAVRHTGPAPAALPPYAGPAVDHTAGRHRLDLVVDGGRAVAATDLLAISGAG